MLDGTGCSVGEDVPSNALRVVSVVEGIITLRQERSIEVISFVGIVKSVQGDAATEGVGVDPACDTFIIVSQVVDGVLSFCLASGVEVVGGVGAVKTIEGNRARLARSEDIAGDTLVVVPEVVDRVQPLCAVGGVEVVDIGGVERAIPRRRPSRVAALLGGRGGYGEDREGGDGGRDGKGVELHRCRVPLGIGVWT